jgi:1-acylglycerone phosphate reductase
LKLPEGSLYTPVESTICDRANGIDGATRIEPEDYAKRVVADILNGKTGKIWHGWSAGTVKFSTVFLPTSLMVSIFSELFSQDLMMY